MKYNFRKNGPFSKLFPQCLACDLKPFKSTKKYIDFTDVIKFINYIHQVLLYNLSYFLESRLLGRALQIAEHKVSPSMKKVLYIYSNDLLCASFCARPRRRLPFFFFISLISAEMLFKIDNNFRFSFIKSIYSKHIIRYICI